MSELVFGALTMRNILSIGNIIQVLKLDENFLTLIMGKNWDMGGENQKNGCGKSNIIQALSYVLYGEPAFGDFTLDKLVNNINMKNMLVTIDFTKDGHSYRIERGRKPTIFNYFIDGVDQKKGNNSFSQEDIQNVLGMSHLMFTHLICMNTYTTPFFKQKASEQRELIEELLGISLLTKRDEVAKKLVSDSKKAIDIEQASIKATIDANSRIETAIDRTRNEVVVWENSRNLRIINLKSALKRIEDIDFEKELKIFDDIQEYNNVIKDLNAEISRLDSIIVNDKKSLQRIQQDMKTTISTNNIDGQLRRLQSDLEKQEKILLSNVDEHIRFIYEKIKSEEREIDSNQDYLVHATEELKNLEMHFESDDHFCNSCGQKYNNDDHLKEAKLKISHLIQEQKDIISIRKNNIKNIEGSIEAHKYCVEKIKNDHAVSLQIAENRIIEIANEIDELIENQEKEKQTIDEKTNRYLSEIAILENNISSLYDNIDTINKSLNAMEKPVSSYRTKEEVWSMRDQKEQLVRDIENEYEKQNPHEQNIKNLESTIQVISYDNINELRDTLAHEELIHKLLSGKDSFIRKKIIDQNLYYLNTQINHYLNLLGLPHEVRFISDLSVQISYLGNDYVFATISRGQQGRLILALSWAFRDIWENLNHKISLLFIDELIDNGIDDAGAEAAIAILNKMAREQKRNTFVVSHREVFIGKVNHILMVHLEDQFTRIEANAEV